jgi:hypothetical protein
LKAKHKYFSQFCHTFYDAVCKSSTVQRGFRYNRQICDQSVNRQQCINLPVTDCRVGTTANCRMVPRQVCQDTCSTSTMCNQCDEFRNGPGFGSCGTSTCGTFYPNDPYRLNYTGGEGYYPGGGSIGGEGYYPGGGSIGGEGYYPGGDDGRQPWDDALTPPWDGGETRPPYDDSGRQPWDDALRPPWDGQTRPPYAGGFNVAQAVPIGLSGSEDDQAEIQS